MIQKFLISGLLGLSLLAPMATHADGNHASLLLMLISNKIKMEKLVTAAEDDPSLCSENSQQISNLMKPSMHMLAEYSQEKSGNYVNQSAYADSLVQRAKMMENYSVLLERYFSLRNSCPLNS